MQTFLEIPGDYLEGGGQILRTALLLSAISQRPVRIFNIRAKRANPGLRPQHFYTIKALKEISQAKVEGFSLGSQEIKFLPTQIRSCELNIDIKTAGSIGLLLQPLIPVGCFAPQGLRLNVIGGTCGKGAIPVEYYMAVIIPILKLIGIELNLDLIKRGYYPKGGGRIEVNILPTTKLRPINLTAQGKLIKIQGISHAHKDLEKQRVSQRQKERAEELLKQRFSCPIEIISQYCPALSLGSGIVLWASTLAGAILGADAVGEKGKPAEIVAEEAVNKLISEINSDAAVDTHLADNLIPYLALAGGKVKVGLPLTLHTQTNLWVCEQFFGKIFKIEDKIISAEALNLKSPQ